MGDIPEIQKQMVSNHLAELLSERYALISQQQFEAAKKTAYEALDLSQCTEDMCIRKVQEVLQVENLFFLQLLREGANTQVSLIWVDLEKKTVKTEYCQKCDSLELNQSVDRLMLKMLGPRPQRVADAPPTVLSGTGVLFVVSTPTEADIYINNILQTEKSDAMLKLPPGEYMSVLDNRNSHA